MQYLLDTNMVLEVMRVAPDKAVAAQWERHLNDIAIASTTWHELQFGVRRMVVSRKRSQHEAFLVGLSDRLPVMPYDQRAAEWHAAERARLSTLGKTPSFEDGQIAAVAKVNALVLVTANTSDFLGFEGLSLENWANPT